MAYTIYLLALASVVDLGLYKVKLNLPGQCPWDCLQQKSGFRWQNYIIIINLISNTKWWSSCPCGISLLNITLMLLNSLNIYFEDHYLSCLQMYPIVFHTVLHIHSFVLHSYLSINIYPFFSTCCCSNVHVL